MRNYVKTPMFSMRPNSKAKIVVAIIYDSYLQAILVAKSLIFASKLPASWQTKF